VVALVIVVGTWSLLKESVSLSLDAVPVAHRPRRIEAYLAGLPGVTEVHDLHIWAMSTTEVALTAHLVRPAPALDDALLAQACRDLSQRFGIGHATLQVESGDPRTPARWRRRRWCSATGVLDDAAHRHVEHALDQQVAPVQGIPDC
jgi:cobalt-zinc-cadmium efflux system protein